MSWQSMSITIRLQSAGSMASAEPGMWRKGLMTHPMAYSPSSVALEFGQETYNQVKCLLAPSHCFGFPWECSNSSEAMS